MKKSYLILTFFFFISFSYAQEITSTDAEQKDKISRINKGEEIKGLAIYPNPVSNGILKITTFENAKKTVQIFDVLGKQVLSRVIHLQPLNISMLNSGIYIIKVFEKGKVATRKLVVK